VGFAPTTSVHLGKAHKWNKIEHRMFCHITQNWRATPLADRLTVVELIADTTTKTGLTIRCELGLSQGDQGVG
jgi:hypothetical protein